MLFGRGRTAKKVAKAVGEKIFSSLYLGNISRFFTTTGSASQPEISPNFFNQSEGSDLGIAQDIFQLGVWIRKNKPDLQVNGGSALTLCLGC